MDSACPGSADPRRSLCGKPPRLRLGGFPPAASRHVEAGPVGAGPDGDPGERADLSAGALRGRYPPCRGARRPGRAVGDGGGRKMLRPLCRHRRIVRRPGGARLHRDTAVGGRVGAIRRAMLAGPARRDCKPQRCADAMAGGERAVACEHARHACSGPARLGCGVVPGSRAYAGTMDCRS